MTIKVISPHLDDAVLSLTEFLLARGEPVVVVTVFSEGDEARKAENVAALAVLGFDEHNLGLVDQPGRDTDDGLHVLATVPGPLLAPLGIHHPDHRLVADACIKFASSCIAGFYEELPYRVMYPDERAARVATVHDIFDLRVDSCGGYLAEKRRAVAAYASQIGEDIERCAFAPERIWWVQ